MEDPSGNASLQPKKKNQERCSVRHCSLHEGEKLPCVSKTCKRQAHHACFEGSIILKANLQSLPEGLVACINIFMFCLFHQHPFRFVQLHLVLIFRFLLFSASIPIRSIAFGFNFFFCLFHQHPFRFVQLHFVLIFVLFVSSADFTLGKQ